MGYIYVQSSVQDRKENLFKIGTTSYDFDFLYTKYKMTTPNLEINFCAWFEDEVKIEQLVRQQLEPYKDINNYEVRFQCPLYKIIDAINGHLKDISPSVKRERMRLKEIELSCQIPLMKTDQSDDYIRFNGYDGWVKNGIIYVNRCYMKLFNVPYFNYHWIKQGRKFKDGIYQCKLNNRFISVISDNDRLFINQFDKDVKTDLDLICERLNIQHPIDDTYLATKIDNVEVIKQLRGVDWNMLYILCLNRDDVIDFVRSKIDSYFIVEHKGQKYVIRNGNFDSEFVKVINNLTLGNFKIKCFR